MGITKRLRYFVDSLVRNETTRDILHNVADRIDQEHKSAVMGAMNDALYYANDENMAELGWVRLPKDAEGIPFRVGDHVQVPGGLPDEGLPPVSGTIERMTLRKTGWLVRVFADGKGCVFLPEVVSHAQAPTVEDVLREFAQKMNENLGMYTGEVIDADEWRDADAKTVTEYAAKLRLAGEDA